MATGVLSKASSNYKTAKSIAKGGYVGSILYLSPEKSSGLGNLCPFASKGCTTSCLNTAGRGAMTAVQAGRLRKTKLFYQNKALFFNTLFEELEALNRKAVKADKKAFVRLNGTSDINWGAFRPYAGKTVFEAFPDIQFYDYTKDIKKALVCGDLKPANYHLTFSRSEGNMLEVERALEAGVNVAVVFRKTLPKTWMGYKVLDGDTTDLRFEEGYQGAIVGLIAKGKAKRDTSGFVVDFPTETLLDRA